MGRHRGHDLLDRSHPVYYIKDRWTSREYALDAFGQSVHHSRPVNRFRASETKYTLHVFIFSLLWFDFQFGLPQFLGKCAHESVAKATGGQSVCGCGEWVSLYRRTCGTSTLRRIRSSNVHLVILLCVFKIIVCS